MQQYRRKYFACRPPHPCPDPEDGVNRSNSTFSEHGQIKGNHECIDMVANILTADPFLTLLLGSKGRNSTFSEHGHFTCQIKGNHQMQQHGTCSNYFARRPLPDPGDGVNRSKLNFFRSWSSCISN